MSRYKYPLRAKHSGKYDVDLVDMKCLECGHEEEAELSILLERSNSASKDSPVLICPKCGHELLVPKDVNDQVNGGFIYKIDK